MIQFISPFLYSSIYLIVVTILTIICIIQYSAYPASRVKFCNEKSNPVPSVVLIVIITLFIGFRPLSGIFVDMMNYAISYESRGEEIFEFDKDSTNFIFDNFFKYLASNWYDIVIFFVTIAVIYFGCIYWGLKKIFPHDVFYAIVIFLGAFSTFTYGTNGIKAGAATSIFLLVFAFYKKPVIAGLFALISLGFHHTMFLPIYAFILAYIIKNPKWFFFGWLFCLLLSFFHIGGLTDFLAQLTEDERAETYLLTDEDQWGGKKGFRWDFIMYGLPPIIIGWWIVYQKKMTDRLYQLLLCTYLACNAVWLLCMYVPYNNRIAYLSWFILPIVSIYPFLKFKLNQNQYVQLNYIVVMYLAFTLFSNLLL